jgi:thioredoxin 1
MGGSGAYTNCRRSMSMAEIKNVDADSFDAEVLQSEIPVLVDFWAPWCAPCQMVAPIVEKVAEGFAGRAKVVKVNVDEAPELANRYGIRGIPSLLVFKDGDVVGRMVGVQPESALTSALEAAL